MVSRKNVGNHGIFPTKYIQILKFPADFRDWDPHLIHHCTLAQHPAMPAAWPRNCRLTKIFRGIQMILVTLCHTIGPKTILFMVCLVNMTFYGWRCFQSKQRESDVEVSPDIAWSSGRAARNPTRHLSPLDIHRRRSAASPGKPWFKLGAMWVWQWWPNLLWIEFDDKMLTP